MASVLMCGVEDLLLGGSRFVWTVTVAALRRWYAGRLRACRQALRAWCGLGDVYQVRGETVRHLLRGPGSGTGPWWGTPAAWCLLFESRRL